MTQGLSLRWQFIILNFSSSHRRHFLYVPVPVPVIYLNMYSSKVSDSGVFSVFLYEKDRLSTYCIKYAQLPYSLSIFNTNMKVRPRSMLTLQSCDYYRKVDDSDIKVFWETTKEQFNCDTKYNYDYTLQTNWHGLVCITCTCMRRSTALLPAK